MQVTYTTTVVKEIDKCFNQCPYFGLDGSPKGLPNNSDLSLYYVEVENVSSGEIICTHPEAPDEGYIIGSQDCNHFPPKCPILKGEKND